MRRTTFLLPLAILVSTAFVAACRKIDSTQTGAAKATLSSGDLDDCSRDFILARNRYWDELEAQVIPFGPDDCQGLTASDQKPDPSTPPTQSKARHATDRAPLGAADDDVVETPPTPDSPVDSYMTGESPGAKAYACPDGATYSATAMAASEQARRGLEQFDDAFDEYIEYTDTHVADCERALKDDIQQAVVADTILSGDPPHSERCPCDAATCQVCPTGGATSGAAAAGSLHALDVPPGQQEQIVPDACEDLPYNCEGFVKAGYQGYLYLKDPVGLQEPNEHDGKGCADFERDMTQAFKLEDGTVYSYATGGQRVSTSSSSDTICTRRAPTLDTKVEFQFMPFAKYIPQYVFYQPADKTLAPKRIANKSGVPLYRLNGKYYGYKCVKEEDATDKVRVILTVTPKLSAIYKFYANVTSNGRTYYTRAGGGLANNGNASILAKMTGWLTCFGPGSDQGQPGTFTTLPSQHFEQLSLGTDFECSSEASGGATAGGSFNVGGTNKRPMAGGGFNVEASQSSGSSCKQKGNSPLFANVGCQMDAAFGTLALSTGAARPRRREWYQSTNFNNRWDGKEGTAPLDWIRLGYSYAGVVLVAQSTPRIGDGKNAGMAITYLRPGDWLPEDAKLREKEDKKGRAKDTLPKLDQTIEFTADETSCTLLRGDTDQRACRVIGGNWRFGAFAPRSYASAAANPKVGGDGKPVSDGKIDPADGTIKKRVLDRAGYRYWDPKVVPSVDADD